MRRLAHLLNGSLLLLLVGGSLWAYPHLPAQIPRHFGIDGTADAYWTATLAHWMLLPGIALAVAGLVYGIAWSIGRAPGGISVPNQQQYDALDPADQQRVLRDVQTFLYGTATAVLLLFGGIQGSTYHVATSGADALPTGGRVLSIGIPLVLLVAALGLAGWLPRRVRQLAEESEGAG